MRRLQSSIDAADDSLEGFEVMAFDLNIGYAEAAKEHNFVGRNYLFTVKNL